MRKKKNLEEEPIPDFAYFENNNVVAVYVINPEILELDDPAQRGKAFVFNLNKPPKRQINPKKTGFYPYVGGANELNKLLEGRNLKGKLPKKVVINGREVNSDTLWSNFVPYSFGLGSPEEEYKNEGLSGVRLDLKKFMDVLKVYGGKKRQETEKKKGFFAKFSKK